MVVYFSDTNIGINKNKLLLPWMKNGVAELPTIIDGKKKRQSVDLHNKTRERALTKIEISFLCIEASCKTTYNTYSIRRTYQNA
jgi:hypothetical protein